MKRSISTTTLVLAAAAATATAAAALVTPVSRAFVVSRQDTWWRSSRSRHNCNIHNMHTPKSNSTPTSKSSTTTRTRMWGWSQQATVFTDDDDDDDDDDSYTNTPTTTTTTRLAGWSQQATVSYDDNDDDDDEISTRAHTHARHPTVSLEDCSSSGSSSSSSSAQVVTTQGWSTFDLSSPREWLEHDQEHEHDGGGSPDGGAYTVIRCDLGSINSHSNSNSNNSGSNSDSGSKHPDIDWRIWGLDFHLQRLVQSLERYSYGAAAAAQSEEGRSTVVDVDMIDNDMINIDAPTNTTSASKMDTDTASIETRLVIHELLAAADLVLSPVLSEAARGARGAASGEKSSICVAMVTILWSLDPNSSPHDGGTTTMTTTTPNSDRVRVKGHICLASGVPVSADPTEYDPDPIQVALALVLPSSSGLVSVSNNLPSRKDSYPEAKLSTWCGQRRPLEVQFKSQGVGEVLLVDASYDKGDEGSVVHLLEGLTSNLFVLYPDNVLRTAATGVLHGYARQRVLAQAERLGLTLDFTPIRLDEASMWLECFVTSSIKLIAPVGKIMIPAVAGGGGGEDEEDGTNTHLEEVWSRGNVAHARSVWRELYNGIMLEDHDTH